MGLDFVELVLAVEDKFRIRIKDDEAGSVETVGDLYRLVWSKVHPAIPQDSGGCVTSATFYRIRRAMVAALDVKRRDVRPSTELSDLLPRKHRRRSWRLVQSHVSLSLPRLEHPGWIRFALYAAGMLITAFPMWPSPLNAQTAWLAAALCALGLCTGNLMIRSTARFGWSFPEDLRTVGDLAKNVVGVNYSELLKELKQHTQQEVWDSLQAVIVEQLGVEPEQVVPDARFLDDLRVD